jgi:hypothetical protein
MLAELVYSASSNKHNSINRQQQSQMPFSRESSALAAAEEVDAILASPKKLMAAMKNASFYRQHGAESSDEEEYKGQVFDDWGPAPEQEKKEEQQQTAPGDDGDGDSDDDKEMEQQHDEEQEEQEEEQEKGGFGNTLDHFDDEETYICDDNGRWYVRYTFAQKLVEGLPCIDIDIDMSTLDLAYMSGGAQINNTAGSGNADADGDEQPITPPSSSSKTKQGNHSNSHRDQSANPNTPTVCRQYV